MRAATGIAAITTIAIAASAASAVAAPPAKPSANAAMHAVEVTLPAGNTTFPPGAGSDQASAHCLMCHSAGMVTRQPPLSFDEWKGEVNKMRSVYGEPLPPDKVDEISRYLTTINGKR
jgi:cytochrome c5